MPRSSIVDREADAVYVLSRRLGALRRVLLVPLALLSAAAAVPTYVVLRDWQLAGQWDAGTEVAYHFPLLTGAFAVIPSAILFGLSVLVYRVVRDRRLAVWKRELCAEHELPAGHLDDIGRIFH